MAFVSYSAVVKACAGYVADRMIENANDTGDDVRTYSVDAEVVELYLRDLAADIGKALPAEIVEQLQHT